MLHSSAVKQDFTATLKHRHNNYNIDIKDNSPWHFILAIGMIDVITIVSTSPLLLKRVKLSSRAKL